MNFAAYFVPLSRTGSHQPQKRVSAFEGFYGSYSTMRGSTRPLTVRHCVVGKKASLNAHTKTVFGWGSTAPQIWCSPLQSAQKFNKIAKKVHFGKFLKTWSLQSNSVTRQVNFSRTKFIGKYHKWDIWGDFETMYPRSKWSRDVALTAPSSLFLI